jgi:hypothetical protein
MAVNNFTLKQKVRKAAEYFGRLEGSGGEVDDGEMVALAAYAASVFSEPADRKRICEKLGWNRFTSIADGTSVNDVICMVGIYAGGEKKIDAYAAENARRLCESLVEYVEILEKENKNRKEEELRRKHTEDITKIKNS